MADTTFDLTAFFVAFVGSVTLLADRVEEPHPESSWSGVVALALSYAVVTWSVATALSRWVLPAR
ncbi:hypothetical protein ACFQJC_13905 [Haloferax namakaokahaiae]|uniref:Uncharacterized protein n=1 Tax=Haloferax namakaokahaiae TaxID=1748331 RepID=A0ABD5ZI42_9EURY